MNSISFLLLTLFKIKNTFLKFINFRVLKISFVTSIFFKFGSRGMIILSKLATIHFVEASLQAAKSTKTISSSLSFKFDKNIFIVSL
jgi:hypothetical protein